MRNIGMVRISEITGFLWLVALFCLFFQMPAHAFACEGKSEVTPPSSTAMDRSGSAKKTVHSELLRDKTVFVPEQKKALPDSDVAEVLRTPRFDMDVLISRLKKSDAIGMFTKLALRSDALDSMGLVKAWRRHVSKLTLEEVRSRYNGLLLKVLALLDDDPALSRDISLARESIWKSLMEVRT